MLMNRTTAFGVTTPAVHRVRPFSFGTFRVVC